MFMVRIHDPRTGAEYKVDYKRARAPQRVCVQCMAARDDKYWACPQCGQSRTVPVRLGLPDNGALVSCGLIVGDREDNVSPAQMDYLIATNQAERVDDADKGHGGCQSRCVRRGDDRCQW